MIHLLKQKYFFLLFKRNDEMPAADGQPAEDVDRPRNRRFLWPLMPKNKKKGQEFFFTLDSKEFHTVTTHTAKSEKLKKDNKCILKEKIVIIYLKTT
jgi:hypothetical protein